MSFHMRNLLIPLMLVVSTSSVLAQVIDIKLNCQISLTTRYGTGFNEKEQISELIEIYQNASSLFIVSTPGKVVSMSTEAVKKGYQVSNASDQNRWDLTIEKKGIRGQTIIDRNTGQIFSSFDSKHPNGVESHTEGSGICKKVDTNKKLF